MSHYLMKSPLGAHSSLRKYFFCITEVWTAIDCGHGRMHVMNGENNPLERNNLIFSQTTSQWRVGCLQVAPSFSCFNTLQVAGCSCAPCFQIPSSCLLHYFLLLPLISRCFPQGCLETQVIKGWYFKEVLSRASSHLSSHDTFKLKQAWFSGLWM